jgi:hypothetical protein
MRQESEQKRDLESSLEHLYGPQEVDYETDELVVVCLLRNGRPYIRSFVEHYLSLGVKHLFFLDNGSTDGTVDALQGYESVTVLRSTLPFKEYQLTMKRYLMERFGWGGWVLYADIDELFDYPYSEIVGLGSFLGYLSERSYTAVVGQMLDMFPEEPVEDRAVVGDEPLKERHRFYDLSNVKTQEYIAHRGDHRTPPHVCGVDNALADSRVEVYRGGIKRTLFGLLPALTKHPLVFMDGETKPMDGSEHAVSRATVADITCVVFHYNFTNHFHQQVRRAAEEENYLRDSRKHKKYLEILKQNPSLRIRGESARELQSINDLVGNGFLVLSEDYMRLVSQREPGENGATGEPRRAILALLQAQDEIRLRRRKLSELKWSYVDYMEREAAREEASRVVPESGEENRPPKAQGPGKLEERNRELEEKVRDLQRQLKEMRSSRAWRLLVRLDRLRNRIKAR